MACNLPDWKGASGVQPCLLEKVKAGLLRAASPGWRGRGRPVACSLTWVEREARPLACCLTGRRGEEGLWCAASPC
jgi:hypothetical protein